MLGPKPRHLKTHPTLTLEALVPAGHFYRQLESKPDLEFVRELVAHCHTFNNTRRRVPVSWSCECVYDDRRGIPDDSDRWPGHPGNRLLPRVQVAMVLNELGGS